MNIDEAKRIIEILHQADDGCKHCVNDLLNSFRLAFSEFADIAEDIK